MSSETTFEDPFQSKFYMNLTKDHVLWDHFWRPFPVQILHEPDQGSLSFITTLVWFLGWPLKRGFTAFTCMHTARNKEGQTVHLGKLEHKERTILKNVQAGGHAGLWNWKPGWALYWCGVILNNLLS